MSDSSNSNGFFKCVYNKIAGTSKSIWQGVSSLWQDKAKDQAINVDKKQLLQNLLCADISHRTAQEIIKNVDHKNYTETELRELLAKNIEKILQVDKTLTLNADNPPTVIFITGSNGTGKTLTAAKLAHKMQREKKRVLLCAADNFRAAAVQQLQNLAQQISCPCFTKDAKNPATIIYDAVLEAVNQNYQALIIDTAGRLHNNQNLIMELQKSIAVVKKINHKLWIYSVIVLDANTGQNNIEQIKSFTMPDIRQGIIMNKLDGTAKGGTLIEIAQTFKLPIYGLGYGEKIEDLHDMDARALSRALCGFAPTTDN